MSFFVALLHQLFWVLIQCQYNGHLREAPLLFLFFKLRDLAARLIRVQLDGLLWATEDSNYPRVTGGIFSIAALVPSQLRQRPPKLCGASWCVPEKAGTVLNFPGDASSKGNCKMSSSNVDLIQTLIQQLLRDRGWSICPSPFASQCTSAPMLDCWKWSCHLIIA